MKTGSASRIEFIISLVILVGISAWFFYIHTFSLASTENIREIWGASYQIMALYGGIIGLLIARNWGGSRSLIGRALLFFAIGLFFQVLGQSIDSYYNIFKNTAIPYPSFGDIGFFGSVLVYIYAAILLIKTSGARFSLRFVRNKIWAALIPIVILLVSYFLFLKGYVFDWSQPMKIFLDFGYPLGQALYVSIAIIALIMSINVLGGLIKKPILFLIFALFFQYCADFMFLYQANQQTWYVGGLNDFLYFFSYFIMTAALIYFGSIYNKIKRIAV